MFVFNRDFRYGWLYVRQGLNAHAQEIIAKKQLTIDLLLLYSAVQLKLGGPVVSRELSQKSEIDSWTLSTDYACSVLCKNCIDSP